MRKRILCAVLTLCLCIAMLPSVASAADASVADVAKAYKQVLDSTEVWEKTLNKNSAVAFYDLNGDTLPEMFIGTDGATAALVEIKVWTYHSGAVKQAGSFKWGLAASTSLLYASNTGGIFKYYVGASSGSGEYYSLDADGNLVKGKTISTFPASDAKAILIGSASGSMGMSKQDAKDYLDGFGQFFDVHASQYYSEPVAWAVENGITNGTGAYSFSPDSTCTRAQILTFLWRAAGAPRQAQANPYTDVNASDYYYDAALWAKTQNMVSGNRFEGSTPCTRASTVAYIWQYAGSPATGSVSFSDVPATAAYTQAVAWAVKNGITNGTGANQFSPDAICSRGQIVTFLYRARNIEPTAESVSGWSESYKDFLFTQAFLTAGQEYTSNSTYRVSLYDMDCDGTPELKIDNGETGRSGRCAYIYTYVDDKVVYLGIGPTDAFYNQNSAAGIYGYYRMSADEITCTLYKKDGQSIKTESNGVYTDLTWPKSLKSLYGASIADIQDMGWSAFIEACNL